MAGADHGRTERLELADATLLEWTAQVLVSDAEQGILLDRSAFYPGGGGQPPGHGVLLWGGVRQGRGLHPADRRHRRREIESKVKGFRRLRIRLTG